MKKSLVFTVHGTPRPQPRPRFVRGRVVSTADAKAKLWRGAIDRAVRAAIKASGRAVPLFTGAVKLTAVFTFTPPPSQLARLGTPHTHKPDASNLLKLIEDVMEDAGVFKNDSQIMRADPVKWWGERAGVQILVEDASEERRAPSAAASSAPPSWLMQGLGLGGD